MVNQNTCKIPYNTLDSKKVPKSTVKLTLPFRKCMTQKPIQNKKVESDTGSLRCILFCTTGITAFIVNSKRQSLAGFKQTLKSISI